MSKVIEAWHEYLETRDTAALDALLDEDVVFESPVVFTPQRGKAIATKYLAAAARLLGTATFAYRNTWSAPSSAVLEFTSEIDGVVINGIDIISWNVAGKITHFKVMVRPLKAVNALHAKMAESLSS